MAKKRIDLMQPFRSAKDAARRQSARASNLSAEIVVRGKLVVELDDQDAALTLAQHLAEAVQGDIDANKFRPSAETRERRRRGKTPGRYPAGYTPDPSGPYGIDSGYLRDNIEAAVSSGNEALVGIPRIRQKAAFVIRRISKTARDLSGSRSAKAHNDSLEALLRASLKGGR